MSRIGKMPVILGEGVQVTVTPENEVLIKGSKFTQKVSLQSVISAKVVDGAVVLTRKNDEPQTKAYHGLYRSLVQNAVTGVSKGWSKNLELNGVGYRAKVSGKTLELNLGFSHPINYEIPAEIEIKVEKNTKLSVTGPSKELVGLVSAKIRGYRPPEPYLGKGVKYVDEYIRRKAGKSASK